MFTGIIQHQAVLREKREFRDEVRLTFEILGRGFPFRLGESVAVDGVCVTVTSFRGRRFSADLIPETLQATTLGKFSLGGRVNIERSLKVGDALGGHWVTGHVDGVGLIRKMEHRGTSFRLQIEAPADIIRHFVKKGSVTIDGISLTVQEIRNCSFVVGVIPETLRRTTFQWKRVGERVNLEVDYFAKLIQHFLAQNRASSSTVKGLKRQGF